MTKYALLTLLLVAPLLFWGQGIGPRIQFEETTIDLGELEQGGKTVFDFWFTNVGDQPLVLTTVKSSCGCLVPRWMKEPIPPGERGLVTGQYDSNRIGPCHKNLTVQSNDSTAGTIVLYVKCMIHPKTPVEPTFMLEKEFWASDLVYKAGTLELSEFAPSIVEIPFKNAGMSDLLVLDVVGNSGVKVLSWTNTALAYGKTGQIEVSLPRKIGPFSYAFAVTTNHPTEKVVYVRVEGILADGE